MKRHSLNHLLGVTLLSAGFVASTGMSQETNPAAVTLGLPRIKQEASGQKNKRRQVLTFDKIDGFPTSQCNLSFVKALNGNAS